MDIHIENNELQASLDELRAGTKYMPPFRIPVGIQSTPLRGRDAVFSKAGCYIGPKQARRLSKPFADVDESYKRRASEWVKKSTTADLWHNPEDDLIDAIDANDHMVMNDELPDGWTSWESFLEHGFDDEPLHHIREKRIFKIRRAQPTYEAIIRRQDELNRTSPRGHRWSYYEVEDLLIAEGREVIEQTVYVHIHPVPAMQDREERLEARNVSREFRLTFSALMERYITQDVTRCRNARNGGRKPRKNPRRDLDVGRQQMAELKAERRLAKKQRKIERKYRRRSKYDLEVQPHHVSPISGLMSIAA